MNAQKAYEVIRKSSFCSRYKCFAREIVEALTGEKQLDKGVEFRDLVRFSEDVIKDGVGVVVALTSHNGDSDWIVVAFPNKQQGEGWAFSKRHCGYEEAQKRGLKYGWNVRDGNYKKVK